MTLVTKPFGDIITFSRASGGGRFNSSGVYEWVGNDVPRLTYDPVTLQPLGLLVEEQRTNLLTRSSAFDNASWVRVNSSVAVTPNAVVAPDGTMTADKLIEPAILTSPTIIQNTAVTIVNASYSISAHAKPDGRNFVRLQLESTIGTVYAGARFNLATGAVVGTDIVVTNGGSNPVATITPAANGFFRVSLTATLPAGALLRGAYRLMEDATGFSYTGDGASGIYIWGAQLEAGAFPTSYIPTVASQVTRAADIITINTGAV